MTRAREYSRQEEIANSISHLLGILLGIVAGFFLLQKAFQSQQFIIILSVLIYLFGMLSSYTTSTYYHYLPVGRKKQLFQKLDHAAIYLHIAGTYTPLTLISLQEDKVWIWIILTFVWLFAFIGIAISLKKSDKHSHIKTLCYILMGCSILVAIKPLITALHSTDKMAVFWWIIAGGVSYIIGAGFYSLIQRKYTHTIFHVFVLIGSFCHIIAIYILL